MKNNISGVLVLVGLSLSAAYAADSLQKGELKGGDAKKTDTMKKSDAVLKTENTVLMPAQELKWADQSQGVKLAAAEGDPKAGPHHSFLKFTAGSDMPVHHHSADHYGTVISGTMVMIVEGKEYRATAGSYFSFIAKAKHGTRCESGADCVIFLDARGAWDVVPEKTTKAGR